MVLRVRALDANGDYQLGRGPSQFLVDSSAAVRQKIQTRLLLFQNEWFLDSSVGTPWFQEILGLHATAPPNTPEQNIVAIYDQALKIVILNTPGVSSILVYSSNLNSATRNLTVSASVLTIFSTTAIVLTHDVPINFHVPFGFTQVPPIAF